MYTIDSYTSDKIAGSDFSRIEEFVEKELANTESKAAVNMSLTSPSGYLYNIKNQLRWRQDCGCFYTASVDGNIVAVSAVEYPEGATDWSVGGVRTWITPEYRTRHAASAIMQHQVEWSRARNCDFMLLTFNEYNKAVNTGLQRGFEFLRARGWNDWWADCVPVPGTVWVRHTEQWAVIKPVNCTDAASNLQKLELWNKRI